MDSRRERKGDLQTILISKQSVCAARVCGARRSSMRLVVMVSGLHPPSDCCSGGREDEAAKDSVLAVDRQRRMQQARALRRPGTDACRM